VRVAFLALKKHVVSLLVLLYFSCSTFNDVLHMYQNTNIMKMDVGILPNIGIILLISSIIFFLKILKIQLVHLCMARGEIKI
jgi:hypothetical protein